MNKSSRFAFLNSGWTILVLLAASGFAFAQIPVNLAEIVFSNQKALKHYSWVMRTEVQSDGEVQNVKLEKIRFDLQGKLRKTLISASPREKKVRGPLRKRAYKKKQGTIQKWVRVLSETAINYLFPFPNQLQDFMQRAAFWEGRGQASGEIRIQGDSFIQPRDSVEIYLDALKKRPRKMDVKTNYQGAPIKITADYRDLSDGPTYVAKAIVDYPPENIRLIIETFDYVYQK